MNAEVGQDQVDSEQGLLYLVFGLVLLGVISMLLVLG